eukprot:TRINITY_DN6897_c0_g1_i1.p1 TRINITY_DN6897_c0_g1~~TRINITY_DN6897_c0_g1_i1.p1  ORF type:complete len:228 (+),score=75.84 TRINITY_DN6897_c0_g1_i1:57-686(+)
MQEFQASEDDLLHIFGLLRQKVAALPDATGDRRRGIIEQADADVEEASGLLRRMDAAAKESPQRVTLQTRVRAHEAELSRLRRVVLMTMPAAASTTVDEADDSRARILAANETLDRSGGRITNMMAVCADTEAIGVSTLGDLEVQHNQLLHTRDLLGTMNEQITRGKQILNKIWIRLITDKVVEVIIIVVLLVCIFAVVFFKWIFPLLH